MMRNSPKKSSFLFFVLLGAIVSIGVISFASPSPSLLVAEMQDVGGDSISALEEPGPLLKLENDTSSASLAIAAANSSDVSIQGTCEDIGTAAAVITGLAAAILGYYTAGAGWILFVGAGNALTGLWSCPGFAIDNYDHFARLVNDLIDTNDAKDAAKDFFYEEKHLESVCRGDLRSCSLATLKKTVDTLRNNVIKPSIDIDRINIGAAETLFSETVEFVRLQGIIMMRDDFIGDEMPCDERARSISNVVDTTLTMTQKEYDKIRDDASENLKCSASHYHSFGICYVSKKCTDSTWNNVFSKLKINLDGGTKGGWFLGDCPDKSTVALRNRVMTNFMNSNIFQWWRELESSISALEDLRSMTEHDLIQMCSREICPNDNGLGCACLKDNMCGNGLSCIRGECAPTPPSPPPPSPPPPSGYCRGCNSLTPCQSGLVCHYGVCVTRQEAYYGYPPC